MRKAMFVGLLMGGGIEPVVEQVATEWDRRARGRREGWLAGLEYDVSEQNLEISLRRIPARPADGVVLKVR